MAMSPGTLVNALLAHCGDSLSGIGGVKKPGIVHRIDKDTSGLLVVAKTDAAHKGSRACSRITAAAASGARISRLRLGRSRARARHGGGADRPPSIQREKMAVVSEERGREAITHWELIESFGVASLVACRLETGRTHQIRVHMAHIGHPLIGDATYGAGFKTKTALLAPAARAVVEALGRQALHAATLGFAHPVTREELMFESELPADLAGLREALAGIDRASGREPCPFRWNISTRPRRSIASCDSSSSARA